MATELFSSQFAAMDHGHGHGYGYGYGHKNILRSLTGLGKLWHKAPDKPRDRMPVPGYIGPGAVKRGTAIFKPMEKVSTEEVQNPRIL
jgi:hypothetical protein